MTGRPALAAFLVAGVVVTSTGCRAPTPDAPVADAGPDLQLLVGEEATLDAGGSHGEDVTFTWDFDDGSERATTATATHAWSEPGHYTAVVEVANGGGTDTDSARVDVVHPPLDPPPTASKALVADPGWETVYVALPDFDAVAVVDVASRSVVGHLQTCAGPRGLSMSHPDPLDEPEPLPARMVVACREGEAFEIWEGADRVIAQALPHRGSPPLGAVISPDGRQVHLVHGGLGGVSQWTVGAFVDQSWWYTDLPDARGLARVGDELLVSRFRSADDRATWWWLDRLDEDPEEDGAPGVHESRLDVDPGPDSDTTSRGVPTYLQRLAPTPDGQRLLFPSLQANTLRGLSRDGLPLTHETTARAVLSQASLVAPQLGVEGTRNVFDDRDLAVDVAFSPRGDWLYVAMHGMEAVDVLDAFSLETAGSFQGIGAGVDGVLVSAGGDELWALAALSRELVVFELDGPGSGEEVARLDLLPPGGEVLDSQVLRGKQIFHRASDPRMSLDGYLSCGSCHLDGDGDGRVWDFTDRGEGLRNTIDLRGRGGVLHGPLRWSASFDEVQDFEGDVRGPFAGEGFLEEDDWAATSDPLGAPKAGLDSELDALAAYVESLDRFPRSPWRDDDGGLSDLALDGRAIFNSAAAGCADCHPSPEFTDSQWLAPGQPLLHDVGTLTEASGGRLGEELLGLDTPTLRAVWSTPPYLHDGSAPTLRDVLTTANPADEHGGTSHLDDGQLDALERYLLESTIARAGLPADRIQGRLGPRGGG